MSIDLRGLDKAAVLAALYNASAPMGLGLLHYDPTPMTVEEARELLPYGYFGYLKGRVMQIDLRGDELNPWGYDRDNGEGVAQSVIQSLILSGNPDNMEIHSHHVSATRESAADIRSRLSEESETSEEGDFVTFTLGVADMADYLRPALDRVDESLDQK